MGVGVRVIPNDSNKPIDITANCRIPQFCGRMRLEPGKRYNIPNYVTGSEIYCIIDSFGGMNIDMGMRGKPYNGWTYQPRGIKAVHVSGNQIWADYAPNSLPWVPQTVQGFESGGVTAWVFQVLPVGANHFGIKLVNASSLMEVSNVGITLKPIWRGTAKFTNGIWQFPQIGNYDKKQYIAFAHWTNAGVGLTRNNAIGLLNSAPGSTYIAAYQGGVMGQYEMTGHLVDPGGVEVVLFYPSAPETTPVGINIFNAQGHCSWSTKTTPFLLRGTVTLSKSWSTAIAGVQRAMVPVTMGGFWYGGPQTFNRNYGVRSNGNQFTVTTIGSGKTTTGSPAYEAINNFPMPVIDAADYF